MNRSLLKQLPKESLPRERLIEKGADALSNRELLALLIGSGSSKCDVFEIADQLILRFRSLTSIFTASLEQLQSVPGIGPQKAHLLKAAFTLAQRMALENCRLPSQAFSARQLYQWLKLTLVYEKQEVFGSVFLSSQMHLIKFEMITKGTLTETLVHPRELFSKALEYRAHSVVLVHNHPSGNLEPSKADLEITKTLVKAGELLSIPVYDHLIVSSQGYFSFKEHQLI